MVLAVIALTDRVLLGMRARRWGRIIASASSGVVSPIPDFGPSNALRPSLVGWSKALAREVGRDGGPAEYGDVVVVLASVRAAYLSGSVVRVDGGPIAGI